MAARDEETSVGRAIESILAQTVASWELVLVDDGSRDGTADVARSYRDERVRVLRTGPRGLPAALNTGLAVARAPVVARQDADDVSLPHRLERQLDVLARRPEVTVVAAAWRELDAAFRPVRPRTGLVTGDVNAVLHRFNPVVHSTAAFRRDAILALGGYDERLPYAADYDLWLRVVRAGGLIWIDEEELAVRVMSGVNMSGGHERSHLLEELRVRARDVRARRAAGERVGPSLVALARRVPMLAVPVAVRRRVRARRGQAP